MAAEHTIALVILAVLTPSLQNIADNRIEDANPLAEAASAILKEQNAENIGGLLNNLLHSDGAKQLGDIFSNAGAGENAGQILQGLGSVLGHGQGLDPSVLGAVMGAFQDRKSDEGPDLDGAFGLLGSVMGGGGDASSLWEYAPLLLQTANAFLGPEAEERARGHAGHSQLLPPFLEKLHVMFDHFMNSELAKKIINTIGAEKFVRVFVDDEGRISFRRVVEMLENHSFRKHWIRMVTNRLALLLSYFKDVKIQRKYITTFQHFINSILKSQGFPKTTLFDSNRPTDTLSALINHIVNDQFHIQFSSKQYVKPAVEYFQDMFRLLDKKRVLPEDTQEFSDKLADTINLEVIEPVARVNRAYRFARKHQECDKYVMCLVNREVHDETPSLPGLRPLLSKSASLILSWFLSGHTKTPFWTFYTTITTNVDCQTYFAESCHNFHLEEIKVKQEYVHNEL